MDKMSSCLVAISSNNLLFSNDLTLSIALYYLSHNNIKTQIYSHRNLLSCVDKIDVDQMPCCQIVLISPHIDVWVIVYVRFHVLK